MSLSERCLTRMLDEALLLVKWADADVKLQRMDLGRVKERAQALRRKYRSELARAANEMWRGLRPESGLAGAFRGAQTMAVWMLLASCWAEASDHATFGALRLSAEWAFRLHWEALDSQVRSALRKAQLPLERRYPRIDALLPRDLFTRWSLVLLCYRCLDGLPLDCAFLESTPLSPHLSWEHFEALSEVPGMLGARDAYFAWVLAEHVCVQSSRV